MRLVQKSFEDREELYQQRCNHVCQSHGVGRLPRQIWVSNRILCACFKCVLFSLLWFIFIYVFNSVWFSVYSLPFIDLTWSRNVWILEPSSLLHLCMQYLSIVPQKDNPKKLMTKINMRACSSKNKCWHWYAASDTAFGIVWYNMEKNKTKTSMSGPHNIANTVIST